MAQKSALAPEVRVSELEAELQAKDSELRITRERLKQADDERRKLERQLRLSSSQYTSQLESRVTELEGEVNRLRTLEGIQYENERLRLELEHAVELRTAFEDKFKETKVKLLSLEHEPSDRGSELLLRENESMRRELAVLKTDSSSDKVKSLEQELYTLKECYDRLYEETRQEAVAYSSPEYEDIVETPRVPYRTPQALKPDSHHFIVKSKQKSESQSTPPSQMSNSKMSGISTASYCPSFLRNRKTGARPASKEPDQKPFNRFLRLDSARETFEGVESDL